jgi:hypothetical protein
MSNPPRPVTVKNRIRFQAVTRSDNHTTLHISNESWGAEEDAHLDH